MNLRYLILPVLLFLVGCFRSEKDIGSEKNPLVIGLSYPYYEKLSEFELEKLKSKMEKDLGLYIDFKRISNSVDILEDIGRGGVDIAFLTLNEYLIAKEYYGVLPKLRVLRGEGKDSYYGVIAVGSREIDNLEKLNGKKIATRSPYSVSGFILPSILFSKLKIKPEFIFTNSFEKALQLLKEGKVDAVSVYKDMADKEKALRVIYEFGPIPNEPLVCRKKLDELLCGRVMNEFVKLTSEKEYLDIFKKMADITGFDQVNIADYKDLHDIIKANSQMIYTFVPEGIKIKKLSEEYKMD